jgi:hypothetical protein
LAVGNWQKGIGIEEVETPILASVGMKVIGNRFAVRRIKAKERV